MIRTLCVCVCVRMCVIYVHVYMLCVMGVLLCLDACTLSQSVVVHRLLMTLTANTCVEQAK